MRVLLGCVAVLGISIFASAQTASAPNPGMLAESVSRNGDVIQMHGRVTISGCSIVFADDAVVPSGNDGNPDMNSTIELSGNVRMTFRQIAFEAPRKR
jgi:type 1 fimbria pilin